MILGKAKNATAIPANETNDKKKHIRKREKPQLFPIIVQIAMWIWCAAIVLLVAWAFITAMKAFTQYDFDPLGFPNIKEYPILYPDGSEGPKGVANLFTNFIGAMQYMSKSSAAKVNGENISFIRMMINSLLFCLGTPFFAIVTGMIFSYVLARYRQYKFVNFLFVFVILKQFIPTTENAGTSVYLLKLFKLYDKMWGWWLWCCGPLGFFYVLYASWVGLPKEYAEAAQIDGAGYFTIFFRIMLPNNTAIPLVTYITSVIGHWTNYTTPILYLPSYPSIAFVAYRFQFDNNTSAVSYVPLQIAALLLVSLPMIIPVLIMQSKMKKLKFNVVGIKG